jgi:hypothetical protein
VPLQSLCPMSWSNPVSSPMNSPSRNAARERTERSLSIVEGNMRYRLRRSDCTHMHPSTPWEQAVPVSDIIVGLTADVLAGLLCIRYGRLQGQNLPLREFGKWCRLPTRTGVQSELHYCRFWQGRIESEYHA